MPYEDKPKPKDYPKQPKASQYSLSTIEGHVMGYAEEKKEEGFYTRGIQGAQVVLAVHWIDEKGHEHICEVTKDGVKRLKKERPEIYDIVTAHSDYFKAKETDSEGEFKFDNIPAGWWCYIVKAYTGEKKPAQHTDNYGDDGHGGKGAIKGTDLIKERERKEVIVPVRDKFLEDNEAEPKKDDPKTKKFVPGVRKE